MLFELFKNSMRATVELYEDRKEAHPSVKTLATLGKEDLSIKDISVTYLSKDDKRQLCRPDGSESNRPQQGILLVQRGSSNLSFPGPFGLMDGYNSAAPSPRILGKRDSFLIWKLAIMTTASNSEAVEALNEKRPIYNEMYFRVYVVKSNHIAFTQIPVHLEPVRALLRLKVLKNLWSFGKLNGLNMKSLKAKFRKSDVILHSTIWLIFQQLYVLNIIWHFRGTQEVNHLPELSVVERGSECRQSGFWVQALKHYIRLHFNKWD
ncbi:hypothetical protein GH733_004772 [Mirounga leonina]|nr:hypothetical protein GH733_004772 [Mirounga leonina]